MLSKITALFTDRIYSLNQSLVNKRIASVIVGFLGIIGLVVAIRYIFVPLMSNAINVIGEKVCSVKEVVANEPLLRCITWLLHILEGEGSLADTVVIEFLGSEGLFLLIARAAINSPVTCTLGVVILFVIGAFFSSALSE